MVRLNPFSFTSAPVVFFVSATYIALLAALLVVHFDVPKHPSRTPPGTDLPEAWSDLEHITRHYHPYNSHANDAVRTFLLTRIHEIVASKKINQTLVEVIDDNVSNTTFASGQTTVYFEGTNIIVAVRGTDDDESFYSSRRPENYGVLVNAHYDSVSTGYGATDDGVGVVSLLQLLSYFTEASNRPRRTVVLLFNNGEEDFLNGAQAFAQHPISKVPHVFVNLEGAGAGGRATLFRSTDAEVTRFYKGTPRPFGTVLSSDGFKKRLIRSETDYAVFYGKLGLRGLDIAFMEPRARYHTAEDATRETSVNSLWHMLSAAISSTSAMASDTSDTFKSRENDDANLPAGHGADAVWFDLFGRVFILFRLHTLFALSVTMLVVAPLVLIGLSAGLSKADRNYLFARKAYAYSSDDDTAVSLNGWRGFFRFPLVFVISTAAVIGLAYLVVRINPYIVYSSPYAVWSMMLSAWFFLAWFFARGADAMRPSALQRMFTLIWLFIGSFVLLAGATVFANNFQVAGGYFALFYFAGVSVALLISHLELFFAPSKTAFARHIQSQDDDSRSQSESASRPLTGSTSAARSENRPTDDDATETTSLLRGDRRSFAHYGSRHDSVSERDVPPEATTPKLHLKDAYPGEQEWSGRIPSSFWILQFLAIAPIVLILVGSIALLLTSALYQTPADGNSPFFIYVAFAILATLLVAPVGPFIHRFTYHIPVFLFLLCAATVIYNLAAFPFSRSHRLKVYFLQQVDCNSGVNTVSLTGLDGYVQDIVGALPSAQGQSLNCTTPDVATRKELTKCAWAGLPAKVVPPISPYGNKTLESSWLDFTIVKSNKTDDIRFHVVGQNTRACRILFDSPVGDLAVAGGVSDHPGATVGRAGSREIRLWHRKWSTPWDVRIARDRKDTSKLSGKVVCLWSDANAGDVPAYNEVRQYLPVWAIPTKISDGLVEGFKTFEI